MDIDSTVPTPQRHPAHPVSPVESEQGPGSAVPTPGSIERIRVLVADDHALVRRGLVRFLAMEPDIEVVGEAADGKLAVELTDRLRPDVVTMDVNMPVMSGVEATRRIRAACPTVRVIALSMHNDCELVVLMREAGAADYVPKSGAANLLIAAIRACRNPQSTI